MFPKLSQKYPSIIIVFQGKNAIFPTPITSSEISNDSYKLMPLGDFSGAFSWDTIFRIWSLTFLSFMIPFFQIQEQISYSDLF